MNEISIYQTESGTVEVRLEKDAVWLSQEQMAALFDVQKAAISKHLKNIYDCGELERTATVSKMETVQQEGTRFRQWATRLLREHLTQGYTLNRQRLETNARELEAALLLAEMHFINAIDLQMRAEDMHCQTGKGAHMAEQKNPIEAH